MENNTVKVCKNKHCQKVLPENYKYKYCEACRNMNAQKVKHAGEIVVGVFSVVVSVITGKKILSRK